MSTSLDALRIRKVLGRKIWSPPEPFGPDGWRFVTNDKRGSIVVTCADREDGTEYVHASIAWTDRMPSYAEMCLLHTAVFGDGYAYQAFVPRAYHVNIHSYALHLWGRLDGGPILPEFSMGLGTI